MIQPRECDIGRKVRHPQDGVGELRSISALGGIGSVVFVRFGKKAHSLATHVQDLEWVAE